MGYAMLLFKRRAQDHWELPQFTLPGIASILRRDAELRTAMRNPGVLAVAAAMRSSTFGAQGARHNGRIDHREVRYGLLSGLQRAGVDGRRYLLAEVSSFVTAFNREAVERRAAGLRARQIQSHEMNAFADLVERLPSRIRVESLLCGLASCLRGESRQTEDQREAMQAIPA